MKIASYYPRGRAGEGGLSQAAGNLERGLAAEGVELVSLAPGEPLPACDLVHFHGLWQPPYLSAARSLGRAKIPYAVTPHGMLEPWALRHKAWKKWPYFYAFERPFLRRAGLLFASARPEAQELARLFPGQSVRTVAPGLSARHGPAYAMARVRLGWKDEVKILLYLSRIHPKKGLDLLLAALRALPEDARTGWRLVVVGSGERPYLDRLRRFATRHAAELPPIEWKGEIWTDEKWAYLQGADLFCLPTHSENFGLAVQEAMQVGTPILTTDKTPWCDDRGTRGFHIASPTIPSLREQIMAWREAPSWTAHDREALSAEALARFDARRLARDAIEAFQDLLTKGDG